MVVFTSSGGTLSSLQLEQVDLEASSRATLDARLAASRPPASAEAAPRPPGKAVVTITEKDIPPISEAATAGPADAGAAMAPPAEAAAPVAVESWRRAVDPQSHGLLIVGNVRNRGGGLATAVAVTVELIDETGALLATSDAVMDQQALPPGGSTGFRAAFPGIHTYSELRFDVRQVGVEALQTPAAAPAAGDEDTLVVPPPEAPEEPPP
jgi:hypothetical protein